MLFAAGLGTRFGGLKPLAPVGPAGTSLLEVSIAQAFEAGIEDVVLVVGAHTEGPIGARFAGAEGVRLARQDRLGPSRAKPWGTVAALLSAGLFDRLSWKMP